MVFTHPQPREKLLLLFQSQLNWKELSLRCVSSQVLRS